MPEIDLQKTIQEIRERAEQRRRENPEIEMEIQRQRKYFSQDDDQKDPGSRELELNLRQANLCFNPTQVPPGTRFSLLKRLLMRVLRIYAHGQVEFNASVIRTLNQAWRIVKQQRETIEALRRHSQHQAEFLQALIDLRTEGQREEGVRKLAESYRSGGDPELRSVAMQSLRLLDSGAGPPGFDYLLFQDRFRGSEAEIKNRQAKYVSYFEHRQPVLDLACGRGEFLELLLDRRIEAEGVDADGAMVQHCRAKGLPVQQADIFDHLEAIQEESLGGIFAAQLIEHLSAPDLVRLLSLSLLKLATGGVLLLESINPGSLFVFAHSLYLDPTHRRLYHPLSLEFICRNLGFTRCAVDFGSPVGEEWRLPPLGGPEFAHFNQATERLNSLLYGPQDMALVAFK